MPKGNKKTSKYTLADKRVKPENLPDFRPLDIPKLLAGVFKFKESPTTRFTTEDKIKFLELYSSFPSVGWCANQLSYCRESVFYQFEVDPDFKRAFDDMQEAMSDQMEQKLYEFGHNPKGFLDRIAWLSANRKEKWDRKHKVQVDVNFNTINHLADRAKKTEYVDADYVTRPKLSDSRTNGGAQTGGSETVVSPEDRSS